MNYIFRNDKINLFFNTLKEHDKKTENILILLTELKEYSDFISDLKYTENYLFVKFASIDNLYLELSLYIYDANAKIEIKSESLVYTSDFMDIYTMINTIKLLSTLKIIKDDL